LPIGFKKEPSALAEKPFAFLYTLDYLWQYIGNIYGMDYATGLEEVMGAKPRKVEMSYFFNRFRALP
jgi:hypothetical protein